MKFLTKNSHGFMDDYDTLWEWSVRNKSDFWQMFWQFSSVIGDAGERIIKDEDDLIRACFFPDAKLNYAENLLHKRGSDAALIFYAENGKRVEWSWDKLYAEVSLLQQGLKAHGLKKGDCVAGFVPNTPYAISAMLAVTSLGAIWSSCSPDFGLAGVLDRFGQIEPKILFCSDGYSYNGKLFSSWEIAEKIATKIPSIKKLIIMPHIEFLDGSNLAGISCKLADFIQDYSPKEIEFTKVSFLDPLFILYSSGTTGLPKCIVHSVGGILLQHLKEHQLQSDIKPGDTLFYFSTCGWMMWNWLVSALASKATLILFDGSPFYPNGNRLADIVAKENVTHFGTSAKYIDACIKADITPIDSHDLSNLKTIFSTGSPLSPESFSYIYKKWKADICLASVAGGTDIAGCFVGGSPISPVYSGECQKRQLAMDVQVFDENGKPVYEEPGELVCLGSHPSLPVCFWNDPKGEKYYKAYFDKFENIWHHGDWVTLTSHGGMIFYGRSDAVLNPGGVRIGTAEIYRQINRIEEVLEGLVIGQKWDNDVRVILFVKLREGVVLNEDLQKRIKFEIRSNASPRHVPTKIIAVTDIPRTQSGKITELAVRDIVHGRKVRNIDALANPEALKLFYNLPELQM